MRPDPLPRRAAPVGLAGTGAVSGARAPTRAVGPDVLRIPPGYRLAFTILRAGTTVGSRAVSFARTGAALLVTWKDRIIIRFGPIPVLRYIHHAEEAWDLAADGTGVLRTASARTDIDCTKHFMRARATPDGFAVESDQGGADTGPPGTLLATHWKRAELNGSMVNPQGGKLLAPQVQIGLRAPVALADGNVVEARRCALTGDAKLDLWYDLFPQWAATRFVAQDDSVVLYRGG